MSLELANFPVKEARFGKRTLYKSGVLEVDKDELLALVLADKNVASAELDVALPGEQTRIVRVRDVVEPRVKVSGLGCVFPGILGTVETVGEGRTHTMPGVAVMVSADYNPQVKSGSGTQNSGVVDMWGPGAQLTPFGKIINIVLVLKLIDDVSEVEAHNTIQLAEFRFAQRLAETTRNLTPESMEVFDLFDVNPSLPRVIYDATLSTTWHEPLPNVLYYGLPLRESLTTFIHPNELLDGALTVDARRGTGETPRTWEWMNNPVVLGLLREHGKRVNFLGVILQKTRYEAEWCKHIGAECASQMARLLRADGIIITKISPSGNNTMDVMFTVEACEKKGLKVVFLTPEYGGSDGTEPAQCFYGTEDTVMVSTGSMDRGIRLPAPTKVIGCEKGEVVALFPQQPISSSEPDLDRMSLISGGIDYLGLMCHTCKAG